MKDLRQNHITIIGGGAWGTALAQASAVAADMAMGGANRPKISLYLRNQEHAKTLDKTRENSRYLPGLKLHPDIRVIADLELVRDADFIVLVVPGQNLRDCLTEIKNAIKADAKIILAIKGLEQSTHLRMSEIVQHILPDHSVAVLSGPSFAHEVMRGLPCSLVLAAKTLQDAAELMKLFASEKMRIYPSCDIVGVELGGAVKNVLAIACGIAAGLQLGENARAALVTRGLAEMMRLGAAMGAETQTLFGLSGMGDLVLTCGGTTSRNFRFGLALGQGDRPDHAAHKIGTVEGLHTVASLVALAQKFNIELPIINAVMAIIEQKMTPLLAVQRLMSREAKYDGE